MPEFRVTGSTELGKGDRQALDEAEDIAASAPELPADVAGQFDMTSLPEITGGGSEDIDAELFAPTDFPNRPLTHGASFGPGATVSPRPRLSDRQLLARYAERIVEARDSVPEGSLVWAMRVLAGE